MENGRQNGGGGGGVGPVEFLQRAAMLALHGAVLATAIPFVCLSVCLSVRLSVYHTPVLRQNDGT